MTKSDYQKAYETAEKELANCLEFQKFLEKRILHLRQNLSSLATLCKTEDIDFDPGTMPGDLIDRMGITDDIYSIVNNSDKGLIATQVRDRLIELGYDLSK